MFLDDENSNQNSHQQRQPPQHPSTQRLAGPPPLRCCVFPENLSEAILQTFRQKEGQSLNCSRFQIRLQNQWWSIKQRGSSAGRNVGRLTEESTDWRGQLTEAAGLGLIGPIGSLSDTWKTSDDTREGTELILNFFLLLRGKKKSYVISKGVIYQHVILESEESKSTGKNICFCFPFCGNTLILHITLCVYSYIVYVYRQRFFTIFFFFLVFYYFFYSKVSVLL